MLLVEHYRRGPFLVSVLKRLGRGAVDARMLRDERSDAACILG